MWYIALAFIGNCLTIVIGLLLIRLASHRIQKFYFETSTGLIIGYSLMLLLTNFVTYAHWTATDYQQHQFHCYIATLICLGGLAAHTILFIRLTRSGPKN